MSPRSHQFIIELLTGSLARKETHGFNFGVPDYRRYIQSWGRAKAVKVQRRTVERSMKRLLLALASHRHRRVSTPSFSVYLDGT